METKGTETTVRLSPSRSASTGRSQGLWTTRPKPSADPPPHLTLLVKESPQPARSASSPPASSSDNPLSERAHLVNIRTINEGSRIWKLLMSLRSAWRTFLNTVGERQPNRCRCIRARDEQEKGEETREGRGALCWYSESRALTHHHSPGKHTGSFQYSHKN